VRAFALALLVVAGCKSADKAEPKKTVEPAPAPAGSAPTPTPTTPPATPPPTTPPAAQAPPEVSGLAATDVVAKLGKATYDLGGSEGEGCFVFERAPDHRVCFDLDTEQASWAEVQKKNYKVGSVHAITAEDKTGPTATKL
jgi:hypothetical protein